MQQDELQIEVYVRISNTQRGSGALELRENVTMGNVGFAQMAEVMSRFHDLFQSLQLELKGKQKQEQGR